MNHEPLTGLIAAPFTPMARDGALDLNALEKYAGSLVASGVSGVFVCGTTGEGMSLTLPERMELVARWKAVVGDDLRLVVQVGHLSLPDCRTLAAHAQKIGADAIGCMAPCFFKPIALEELFLFCQEVASAADELPFYYYHIPALTGVHISVVEFLKMAEDRFPGLAGVKYTEEDLMEFRQCNQLYEGRYDLLFGRDEILLAGLTLGARGAIGSFYNFAAPLFQKILRAFEKGDLDLARKEQTRAMEMAAVLRGRGGLPAFKAVMKMIGLDCGPVRLPLRCLSRKEEEALREELDGVDFFSFCSRV